MIVGHPQSHLSSLYSTIASFVRTLKQAFQVLPFINASPHADASSIPSSFPPREKASIVERISRSSAFRHSGNNASPASVRVSFAPSRINITPSPWCANFDPLPSNQSHPVGRTFSPLDLLLVQIINLPLQVKHIITPFSNSVPVHRYTTYYFCIGSKFG